jgi:hypothetical protein
MAHKKKGKRERKGGRKGQREGGMKEGQRERKKEQICSIVNKAYQGVCEIISCTVLNIKFFSEYVQLSSSFST